MRGRAPIGPTLSARAVQIGILAAAALVVALVNAASTSVDLARNHVPVAPLEPLVWELTSWLGLLVALPPLIAADNALFSRRPVGVRVGMVIALATIFFGVHVTTMIGSRDLIYWLGGGRYDFGPWSVGLVYEGRKDALTFAGMLGGFWLWRAAAARRMAAETAPVAAGTEPAFIAENRRGRVVLRAPDIDWVEAQGNYVALHAGGESYLIRQPLKAMDAKLRGAAFVRTHRRALVNTRSVRAIHRSGAGGLKVELANQEFAPLSDRHRAAVVKALAAG
ncbi:MAG TPA: LytTR family DNA-binding domain-containing protein [Caulobacteraceae bacterium]|nr:LytTR family DNA-binding domain-containing protein [Caulobacteraceae bacterium]